VDYRSLKECDHCGTNVSKYHPVCAQCGRDHSEEWLYIPPPPPPPIYPEGFKFHDIPPYKPEIIPEWLQIGLCLVAIPFVVWFLANLIN